MNKSLTAVAVPDLFALGEDTLVKAALYFDSIYADCYLPRVRSVKDKEKVLSFSLQSQLKSFDSLSVLVEAGVINPVGLGEGMPITNISSGKLPEALRHKIANSLEEGAALLPHAMLSVLQQAESSKSLVTKKPSMRFNPADEIAFGLHLLCISIMLRLCAEGKASPLVSSSRHVELLSGLARHFPSVAKALGAKEASSLIPKQNALAIRILEETLPSVEVRNAVDILYLRDELKDELKAFRAEVGKLSTLIETEPWEKNFQKEVETIVAKEVKPPFYELRRRLQQPSKRMLSHLVSDWKSIATSATVPVTAVLMTNTSLPLSILAGIATGLGIAALKSKVEEWSAKRESSLTFLIEASERLEGSVYKERDS